MQEFISLSFAMAKSVCVFHVVQIPVMHVLVLFSADSHSNCQSHGCLINCVLSFSAGDSRKAREHAAT